MPDRFSAAPSAAAALALSLAGPAAAATLADTFTGFTVLGDSLSDPGNVFGASGGAFPPSPPYFEGRFSNGPVWADIIGEQFNDAGLPVANLAAGGAKALPDDDPIPDLPPQLGLLSTLPAGTFGDRGLGVLFLGGNDIFRVIDDESLDEAGRTAEVQAAAEATVGGAASVLNLGIAEVALLTLGDVGSTPLFQIFEPEGASEATRLTGVFNDTLIGAAAALGPDVSVIDAGGFFDDVLAGNALPEITEPNLPCLFNNPTGVPQPEVAASLGKDVVCSEEEAAERAFFDAVHPNAVVHAAFADLVTEALEPTPTIAPVPLPAGLPLLLAGLGGLVAVRKIMG